VVLPDHFHIIPASSPPLREILKVDMDVVTVLFRLDAERHMSYICAKALIRVTGPLADGSLTAILSPLRVIREFLVA